MWRKKKLVWTIFKLLKITVKNFKNHKITAK